MDSGGLCFLGSLWPRPRPCPGVRSVLAWRGSQSWPVCCPVPRGPVVAVRGRGAPLPEVCPLGAWAGSPPLAVWWFWPPVVGVGAQCWLLAAGCGQLSDSLWPRGSGEVRGGWGGACTGQQRPGPGASVGLAGAVGLSWDSQARSGHPARGACFSLCLAPAGPSGSCFALGNW